MNYENVRKSQDMARNWVCLTHKRNVYRTFTETSKPRS